MNDDDPVVRIAVLEARLTEILLRVDATRHDFDRRLEGTNNLRAEVVSDRALFVTRDAFEVIATIAHSSVSRDYYDEQHRALGDRLGRIETQVVQARSRSAAYAAGIGLAFTVLVAVIIIANWTR